MSIHKVLMFLCIYVYIVGLDTMQVISVEHQVLFSRFHRRYAPPTDPQWSQQWSLVSYSYIVLRVYGYLQIISKHNTRL